MLDSFPERPRRTGAGRRVPDPVTLAQARGV